MSFLETEILIVGAGIIGLSLARELRKYYPKISITIVEKENILAAHASGKNSGVLHAGFYYTSDSLKARFTVEGNKRLTQYCLENNIPINQCGKVVVTKEEKDLKTLYELKERAKLNGCRVCIVDEKELLDIEPNAKTYERALFSPATSTINPKQVCIHIAEHLGSPTKILLNKQVIYIKYPFAYCKKHLKIKFKFLFNAAGLYADKISQFFGIGEEYTLLPFKGIYLSYKDPSLIKKHIYPVPDLNNPFLGVHFTKGVNKGIKVGPTAIPALWRENYNFKERFSLNELKEILWWEGKLFIENSFNFRSLSIQEIKKYYKSYFIKEAKKLVKNINEKAFGKYLPSGIRAQLLDKNKKQLVMDFVVKKEEHSFHILNAVSPAFTSAFPFAEYVIKEAHPQIISLIK